jgi:hypothetical protein
MGVFDTWTEWANPGPKGTKGRRPAKLLGRPVVFYVGMAHGFKDTCLHEE